MKFLAVIIVLASAVFSVDCFNTPTGDQQFSGDYVGLKTPVQGHYLTGRKLLSQVEKTQDERNVKRPRCKARNACVVMGGFCVTNATLCGGRLVPEGCKGLNCQCCVPGTLESKIQSLEQELVSMQHNLTQANLKIDLELKSIKSNMTGSNIDMESKLDSISDANSNQDTKLDSIKTANSQQDSKLDSIRSANTNQISKLDSIKAANSQQDSKLNSISVANTNQISKLDSIIAHQGCPTGFFLLPSTHQCFKFFTDTTRSWHASKSKCSAHGLVLAKPYDTLTLRRYLVERFGDKLAWIGARGSGSSLKWDRDGQVLSNSNALWWPNAPGTSVTTSHCLRLESTQSYLKSHPNQPFDVPYCTSAYYALCEKIMD